MPRPIRPIKFVTIFNANPADFLRLLVISVVHSVAELNRVGSDSLAVPEIFTGYQPTLKQAFSVSVVWAGRWILNAIDRSFYLAQFDARRHNPIWIAHRFATLDFINIVHAFDHLAPYRILAIKEARIIKADEELAVA